MHGTRPKISLKGAFSSENLYLDLYPSKSSILINFYNIKF